MSKLVIRAGDFTFDARFEEQLAPKTVAAFRKAMPFDFEPVFHDPPSNRWFGFQAWSMERVAEYYFVTGDAHGARRLRRHRRWHRSACP